MDDQKSGEFGSVSVFYFFVVKRIIIVRMSPKPTVNPIQEIQIVSIKPRLLVSKIPNASAR